MGQVQYSFNRGFSGHSARQVQPLEPGQPGLGLRKCWLARRDVYSTSGTVVEERQFRGVSPGNGWLRPSSRLPSHQLIVLSKEKRKTQRVFFPWSTEGFDGFGVTQAFETQSHGQLARPSIPGHPTGMYADPLNSGQPLQCQPMSVLMGHTLSDGLGIPWRFGLASVLVVFQHVDVT